MFQAIIAGIFLGLGLGLITGPIFFALVQTSIQYSRKKAIHLGAGIWLSDVLYASILLFFSSYIDESLHWDHPIIRILSLIGGAVIMSVGIHFLVQRFRRSKDKVIPLSGNSFLLFSKGFAINTFNPFTLFFWIGLITGSKLGADYSFQQLLVLCFMLILTIIVGDNIKIYYAERIGHIIHSKWKNRLETLTGLIFLGFGIYLIYLAF